MIKIPLYKYSKMEGVHFQKIKDYVQDTIQFYANCCKIIKGIIPELNYRDNIITYRQPRNLFPLIQVISKGFYHPLSKPKVKQTCIADVKMISDVFNKGLIHNEFSDRADQYLRLLENMLDSKNIIYYEEILTSKPEQLWDIYCHLYRDYSELKDLNGCSVFEENGVRNGMLSTILFNIFNYDKFTGKGFKSLGSKDKWNAYNLCDELNINACPYCNRMYTFTVYNQAGRALTRPELDHYFPQSKFPLFAMSFFNLIPSCKVCNSTFKRDITLNIQDYLHPYMDNLPPNYIFDYEPLDINAFEGDKLKVKVILNKNGSSDVRSDNSLALFKIEEIYKKHNDIVAELILKRQYYPETKIREITKLFNNSTADEIFDSIFNISNEVELIDNLLGKLKSDITNKLRFLM